MPSLLSSAFLCFLLLLHFSLSSIATPSTSTKSAKTEFIGTKKNKKATVQIDEGDAARNTLLPLKPKKTAKPELTRPSDSKKVSSTSLSSAKSKNAAVSVGEVEDSRRILKHKKVSSSSLSFLKSIEEDELGEKPIAKAKKKSIFQKVNQTIPVKIKKTNSSSSPNSMSKPSISIKSPKKAAIEPQTKLVNSSMTISSRKAAKSKNEPEEDVVDEDLISEIRDLPSQIIPDLEKISSASQAYLRMANREILEGVKPYVGGPNAAAVVASAASLGLLVLPLFLVAAIFHQLKSYLSLQRSLLFIQAYLAVYFATLTLTELLTGLEPLRFFYVASPLTYTWTQSLQTLFYLLYLLAQLIHLVVVFSAGENTSGDGATRALSLAQMVVGLSVGLHYYAAVFHRAVAGEPPHADWKVYGCYALCFLFICAFARAERHKKSYLYDGGEEGKTS